MALFLTFFLSASSLAAERTTALSLTIDKARAWISEHAEFLGLLSAPTTDSSCCVMMGDVDGSGVMNVLDVTYLVTYLYKSGPAPDCPAEADVDCSCDLNILDVSCIIRSLYQSGPWCEFCTCEQWEEICGEN
jgi:hypothetical protein